MEPDVQAFIGEPWVQTVEELVHRTAEDTAMKNDSQDDNMGQ